MPLAYWTMAPGAGQALRQPGCSQWRQPSFRMSHWRLPSMTCSLNRMSVQDWSERSGELV